MKFKRVITFTVAATMVIGNCVSAFAAGGVDGAGVVEYDNSVDITYDSFTVPTLTGSKYNFTLDPADELYTFDKTTYARGENETNPGIYFKSEKTAAKIEPISDSNDSNKKDLFKLTKEEVASDAADWKAVVTAVTNDDDKTPTLTTDDKYYVWVPEDFASTDSQNGTTATGKKGAYLELTATNIKTYFDISEKDAQDKYTITMKEDHLAGSCVCDGKLYKDTYTQITTAIVDNKPTLSLDDYVEQQTVNDVTSIKTVKNVYVEKTDGGYELAAAANIKFTPAVAAYQALTDKVTITNKSTKDKIVKAVITMSNIDGLTFKNSDSFASDSTASVFFKATNGTTANDKTLSVAEGATVATAEFTAEVEGATVSPIKYQGGTNPKTGGHNYYNYEAIGTSYNSSSFWITAKANTSSGAAAAWKAYGKALEAAYDEANADLGAGQDPVSVKPSINIVYTVSNKLSEEEEAAAADEEATTAANAFKTTYATILAKTTETIAYADLEDVNDALAAYAELDSAVKAKLTTEKALLDDLKAAAEAKAITELDGYASAVDGVFYVAMSESAGMDLDGEEISSVTVNGKTLTSAQYTSATYDAGTWVGVPWTTCEAIGEDGASSWTFVVSFGTTKVTAIYQ